MIVRPGNLNRITSNLLPGDQSYFLDVLCSSLRRYFMSAAAVSARTAFSQGQQRELACFSILPSDGKDGFIERDLIGDRG